MIAEGIETPSCSVRGRIRRERKVEQQFCDIIADVEGRCKGVFDNRKREVATFVG